MQKLWHATQTERMPGVQQTWYHFASVRMAKKKGEVNLLQESSESEESILKVEEVSSIESCGNRWFTTLSTYKHETKLKCQLDTGATCNVLSYRDLSIIKQDGNAHVESGKTELKLFDGSLMKPLEEVNLRVIHGGKTQVLTFQAVRGTKRHWGTLEPTALWYIQYGRSG